MDKNNNQEVFHKTSINWYPGHMVKTKKILEEKADLIDVVYELVDARIPFSSKIDNASSILKNKPRILIMTKADLADPNDTIKWQKYYETKGYNVVSLANTKDDIKKLVNITNQCMQEKLAKKKNKGNNSCLIHVAIIGIPNVGKSTLINK